MSYSQQNGYVPLSFNQLMDLFMAGVNETFDLTYTTETFVGTGFYKFGYSVIQQIQNGEIKASEIFLKLQEYISSTTLKISRPTVTYNGLLAAFTAAGYTVSIKKIDNTDAGKIFICLDLDSGAPEYTAQKLEVAALIRDFASAGLVSQGDQVTALTLSNSQSFDFKFYLPTPVPVLLKVTAVASDNTSLVIPDDTAIRTQVFANVGARYKLGLDFEPERYANLVDMPWAASVLLQYSLDSGSTWLDAVRASDYDEKVTFDLGDITVVLS